MHKKFTPREIETKWQAQWSADKLYDVGARDASKEKEYLLVEWPYPSGNLHIGHWHAFAVPDIYARHGRMTGKQMLFPMGFDAFGLPAENAAIKHDKNPREWTEGNIAHMKEQLASMGNSFAWDKTANSTDPAYYKWTQWMFTQFFEKGIAYRGTGVVNFCPKCNTVIANEQVTSDDTCERCDTEIEKRELPQWLLRITDYADRLIDDLDDLNWPEHIKEAQRRWIGRSEGAEIDFTTSTGDKLTVFTTRPDTLYGATYMVIAPEHKMLASWKENISNWSEVEEYQKAAAKKAEQDRLDNTKEKTGVKLEGVSAINPANGEEIPIFVADYVLAGYGTGAIMAVPAHDERDFDFAKKYDIEIRQVVRKVFGEPLPNATPRVAAGAIVHDVKNGKYLIQYSHEFDKYEFIFGGCEEGESYEEAAIRETFEETGYKTKFVKFLTPETEAHFYHPGKKINRSLVSRRVMLELIDDTQYPVSEDELNKQKPVWLTKEDLFKKLKAEEAISALERIEDFLPYTGYGNLTNSGEFDGLASEEAKSKIVEKVGGRMTNTYRLRDWSIGRQRYWGVPIPIVYSPEGEAHIVPKEHLPWTLPEDVDFRPTGEAPLAKSAELKKRTEEIFGKGWTPEVETMDTFVDSSWYFLRYLDNENDEELASGASQQDWMQVDLYFGGAEHTTMHLLYSRFWQKALLDCGLVKDSEPYIRRINRGLILGPDGNKMSKSKGNVIDPDEQVSRVGADTVKMYLAFMGPYGEVANYPWDMGGIAGIHRFLERVNGLHEHIQDTESESMTRQLHKTIEKVGVDIKQFKFNTAISAMMQFVNAAEKEGITRDTYQTFLQILAPFAPHLTEELWSAHHTESIHLQAWPQADQALLTESEVTIGVQINGKVRGDITVAPDASEEEVLTAARENENIAKWLAEGEVKKVIYKAGKILNLIVA